MKFLYSRTSLKYLQGLEKKATRKLLNSIKNLPFEGDIKKVKGKKVQNIFRLRVGKYRVLYFQEKDVIKILKIDTRGYVYK
jgi:mRNA interferase RelE/StbE